jgi:peptidoglycan/xylan/chitin deacetylase (PgdA/CDA1 family)
MHHVLKHRLELALSSPAASRIARYRIQGKRLILAYHGIVPEGERPAGEEALFVHQSDFAEQLDVLAELADVAPLDRIDEPGDGRPRVAITFDDGYRGAVRLGVQELVKRGLPATFFVAPGHLNDHVFWWDALADGRSGVDQSIRNYALHSLAGSDERVRTWACEAGMALSDALPAYAQTASAGELRAALESPGITVGSHTWSHLNLAALSSPEVAAEIERPRDWLRAEFGEKAIPWLAYPYGLDCPEVHRAAASSSYVGALRINGGWHRKTDVSAFARPRLNVPGGLSLAGFRARLVGSVQGRESA